MSKRSLTAFAISLLTVASLIAANVKGRIVDSQGQPLIGATATLIALPDSIVITGLMTDVDGGYQFKNLKKISYAVKASMTGMDTEVADFTVNDSTETVELPPIKLYDTSTVLNELLVKGVKAAVVAKEDTIEYNADSFHTTDNAMVEDLLKKMPGMEVGKDGSITANGKTVSKILINGKEAYGDDPSMATKNFSAKAVSKVQVVDRKSEQARLTGVDDGEDETVINLTIKKGMENSWFGNVKLGYGTDSRYTESFTVTNMNDGNRVTINGRANNINERGGMDMGRGNFGMGGGSGGILTAQQLGVDFAVGNEETLAVGGFVRYDHGDRTQENSSETKNQLTDSVSYQNSTSSSRDKSHDISAFFRARWNPNENNTFDFRPSFSYNFRNTTSNSLSELFAGDASRTKVNSQLSDRINRGNNWTARGELTYVHRFSQKKGRSFSVRGEYSFTNNRQHMVSLSEIARYLIDNEDEDLFRYTDNKTWNNNMSLRLTWTEPIGKPGNFLEFAYNINARNNNADKYVYNIPMDYYYDNNSTLPFFDYVPIGGELSDTLSNSFRNEFLTQSLRFGYVYTNKEMNLNAGVEVVPSSSKSTDLIISERTIPRRNVLNFAPFVRFRYKFSKTRSMNLRYNARSSQPSMSQLQPVKDESDPMNIKIGNPDLKPTFTQRFNGMFRDFDMDNQRSVFASINGSYTINNVVSKTTTNNMTGARETTYTNTSGDFSIGGMGRIDQPLRNRNWRFSANLNASYSSMNGYTNGLYNRSGNLNLRPRAGMTFSTEIVQISVNPSYGWQLATSTLAKQRNNSSSSYGFDSDFTLTLPCGLQMSTGINYSKTEGLSAGYDSSSWIWNANIQYVIPNSYGISIFAEAHDILGDTKNISRTVSFATITDNSYNNLTRYFMFGVSWQFNSATWKKKKDAESLEDDMPMPGPGMMGPGGPGGQRPMGPPPGGFGGGFRF